MSPTISSMMSSSVISPCSAPYSSTTSAKCVRRLRNSRICSSSGVDFGHEIGLHRHVHDVERPRARRRRRSLAHEAVNRARRSLAWITPTMFSRLAAEDRDAGVRRVDRLLEDLVRAARRRRSSRCRGGASSPPRPVRWPRSSAPSSRSRSSFSTVPSEWRSVMRPGDLLAGRRGQLALGSVAHPEEPQHQPHEGAHQRCTTGDSSRDQQPDRPRDPWRQRSRALVIA